MSDTVTDSMVDGMTLTDNAAKKCVTYVIQKGNNDLMLRVYVTGGGCSGFRMVLILKKTWAMMMLPLATMM